MKANEIETYEQNPRSRAPDNTHETTVDDSS